MYAEIAASSAPHARRLQPLQPLQLRYSQCRSHSKLRLRSNSSSRSARARCQQSEHVLFTADLGWNRPAHYWCSAPDSNVPEPQLLIPLQPKRNRGGQIWSPRLFAFDSNLLHQLHFQPLHWCRDIRRIQIPRRLKSLPHNMPRGKTERQRFFRKRPRLKSKDSLAHRQHLYFSSVSVRKRQRMQQMRRLRIGHAR